MKLMNLNWINKRLFEPSHQEAHTQTNEWPLITVFPGLVCRRGEIKSIDFKERSFATIRIFWQGSINRF